MEEFDGREAIMRPGLSYLPKFFSAAEGQTLLDYFAGLTPLWEHRFAAGEHARQGRLNEKSRRLTRPVYWLGGWQFACLGYYAEPDHREQRCVRAEPFPPVMATILARMADHLVEHDPTFGLPNTALINYYGRETTSGPPVDYARLKLHRDEEPGPVAMLAVGQPGLLEFVDMPPRNATPSSPRQTLPNPELSVWTRHRSVTILSGPHYKDRLYHRISQVRYGEEPRVNCQLENFEPRRISVSFRHVPEAFIHELRELDPAAETKIRAYLKRLARSSKHFDEQLRQLDHVP